MKKEIIEWITIFLVFLGLILMYSTIGIALILTGKRNRNIYQ
jgi:hypothetical protein